MKKDEGNEKKSPSARGRIMQVVEVEEDDAAKQKVDIPVPSDIVKEPAPSYPKSSERLQEKKEESEEKPDIAAAFPMQDRETPEHVNHAPEGEKDVQEDIHPLKPGEKKDIVSELFETQKTDVHYPNISLDKKSSPFSFIIWVVVLVGIVALIGGGILYFKNRSASTETVSSESLSPTPTPSPMPTETPTASVSGKVTGTPTKTASPSAKPKPAGLSIQVLNGSGKSGVAGTMKKFLEEKGYTVVGTGNAANFDYSKTEIIIKAEKSSLLDKLKSDLSANYSVGSTSATLDPKAAYDAQVIIGKE